MCFTDIVQNQYQIIAHSWSIHSQKKLLSIAIISLPYYSINNTKFIHLFDLPTLGHRIRGQSWLCCKNTDILFRLRLSCEWIGSINLQIKWPRTHAPPIWRWERGPSSLILISLGWPPPPQSANRPLRRNERTGLFLIRKGQRSYSWRTPPADSHGGGAVMMVFNKR